MSLYIPYFQCPGGVAISPSIHKCIECYLLEGERLFREIALEEPVTGSKTKKYKQFVTKLRAEFVKVTEEETQNVGTP